MRTIILLAALLSLVGAASATDYTATVADGAATTLFDELCAALWRDIGQPAGWTDDKCATRLVYEGGFCYSISSTEVAATAARAQSITDASDRFAADWVTPTP